MGLVPWGPTLSQGQWGSALSLRGGNSLSGQQDLLQALPMDRAAPQAG